MTKELKLDYLNHAYISKKVDDPREEITIINDTLPKEFTESIKEIHFNLNDHTGTFELDYQIMADACQYLSDLTLLEIEKFDDDQLFEREFSSVYTHEQLAYLNPNNESDISDIVHEYNCDIHTACAEWYNRQVRYAVELIREYILK